MPRKYTPEEREAAFWSKVDKNGPTQPHMATRCWVWTAGTREGYGAVEWEGRTRRAHVVAWMLVNGPLPPGEGYHGTCVLHECDHRPCIRPDHLHTGTVKSNAEEAVARGRLATGDRNGARLHPEMLARGDANGARLHPEALARGEQVHGAKLTEADIPALLAASATGESQRAIARRFGVSQSQVCRIIHRDNWT